MYTHFDDSPVVAVLLRWFYSNNNSNKDAAVNSADNLLVICEAVENPLYSLIAVLSCVVLINKDLLVSGK